MEETAGRSAEIWRNSVRNHADNLLHRPVDQIDTGDVLRVIGPLWTDRHDTAKKSPPAALFGVQMGGGRRAPWRTIPPARRCWPRCPAMASPRRHMAALPPGQVPAALAAIDNSGAYPTTKLAMRMLALTATRSGEVRGMCWNEIEGDIWTIPGERTQGRPRVPGPAEPRSTRGARRGTPLQRRRSRLTGVPVLTRPAESLPTPSPSSATNWIWV